MIGAAAPFIYYKAAYTNEFRLKRLLRSWMLPLGAPGFTYNLHIQHKINDQHDLQYIYSITFINNQINFELGKLKVNKPS